MSVHNGGVCGRNDVNVAELMRRPVVNTLQYKAARAGLELAEVLPTMARARLVVELHRCGGRGVAPQHTPRQAGN